MAVAAKEQESAGMDKAELKKTLILAKRMPMHVALALDGAGAAIVVLDKIKKGETIVRELKSKAKDSKSHRFGICVIDEDNPKRAIFTVNKAAGGGMARKLIKALKGTGFSKVIVKLEDGTVDEQEEDEDEEEEGEGDGLRMRSPEVLNDEPDQQSQPESDAEPPPAQTADAGDTTQGGGDAPATGEQTQRGGGLNAGDLAKKLTELAKQMMGVIAADPTQKDGLVELATSARASLEKGDLQQAGASMDLLREVMNGASSGAATPPASGDTLGPNDPFPTAEAPEGTMPDMSAAQPA